MAVEIKELVIRAVVQDEENKEGNCGGGEWTPERQASFVRQAVEEVLRILKEAKER